MEQEVVLGLEDDFCFGWAYGGEPLGEMDGFLQELSVDGGVEVHNVERGERGVTYASFGASTCILSERSRLSAIFLASMLVVFSDRLSDLLYAAVTLSFNSFSYCCGVTL